MPSILYLLRDDEISAWHRIDAAEVWHFHAGARSRSRSPRTGGRRAATASADLAPTDWEPGA